MRDALMPAGGWHPFNHAALTARLDGWRVATARGRLVAAFDWDNTIILGDIGDHVFAQQLEAGCFAMRAEDAAARLARWPQLGEALVHDIAAAWRACAAAVARPGAPGSWAEAAPHAHADLRARLAWAMYRILETAGPQTGEAFLWQAAWLDGLTPAQVAQLTLSAWRRALGRPMGHDHWQTATAGEAGHRQVAWAHGIRRCPQMEGLLAALAAAGVEVWVVTASHQQVVQALAAALQEATGGALTAARVLGMRPDRPREAAATTWREGKVAAIEAYVGQAPVLCAGDAATDFEMLTRWSPPALSLVVHRNQPAPMDALYRAASQAAEADPPRPQSAAVLVQARDPTTGSLVPHLFSAAGPTAAR